MRMQLCRVTPRPVPEFLVVAENPRQASEIFVTYANASGFFLAGKLTIERHELTDERAPGLDDMLERGVPGIAQFTNFGWSLIPPG